MYPYGLLPAALAALVRRNRRGSLDEQTGCRTDAGKSASWAQLHRHGAGAAMPGRTAVSDASHRPIGRIGDADAPSASKEVQVHADGLIGSTHDVVEVGQ